MRRFALIWFVLYCIAIAASSATANAASTITRHDRDVIRFFHHHPQLAATPAGAKVLAELLPRVVRSLQAAEQPAWPAHHQLWLCINDNESKDNWAGVNPNGHYGGLQMHEYWGYGTSRYASDDSQLVQEQAAERAYAASGYSSSFLYDQWFDYDYASYCLKYA